MKSYFYDNHLHYSYETWYTTVNWQKNFFSNELKKVPIKENMDLGQLIGYIFSKKVPTKENMDLG